MIKRSPIQLLEHGKALCGKTFSRFVEAWNWIFSFFVYMRGDADIDPQNGHITRDDSGSFPVFRLVNADFGSGGGTDIKFIGTDTSEAILGNPSSTNFKTLTFASASDSNIVVKASGDGNGNVTLTIGAYYV